MFENIPAGPPDVMYYLKKKADEDTSPEMVDVGVGIYRDEEGKYQELDVVRTAKRKLDELDLGHDYELTTGDPEFLRLAAKVMFGKDSEALSSGRLSSVQTISGTGANHMAALLLATTISPRPQVFIGVPTWSNTLPLFQHVGLDTVTYPYTDPDTKRPDLSSCLQTVRGAPRGSIFAFQGCCHNPTGADLTADQWRVLGRELKAHGHVTVLDVAYQGLGTGLGEDAVAPRVFCELGLEVLVCQSFSKNFALYGERCGVLHVVARKVAEAERVQDRLRSLVRSEYSSSPAYGSRIVKLVLGDECEMAKWVQEISKMRARLQRNRHLLHKQLTVSLKTPGDWDHIVNDKGLFSCLGLTPEQCDQLVDHHHVHLPRNSRINVAGLNLGNIRRAAEAIDAVVRGVSSK